MNIDDIHSVIHKHLCAAQRQELASWLMMESDMQASSDEYYEAWDAEQKRRQQEELLHWQAGLSGMKKVLQKKKR